MRPEDCKYTETHEWIRIEDENICVVGITDYAVEHLTDLTYIDLPEEGESVTGGESCGEIESVKAVSEITYL